MMSSFLNESTQGEFSLKVKKTVVPSGSSIPFRCKDDIGCALESASQHAGSADVEELRYPWHPMAPGYHCRGRSTGGY
jgi:hypothetical protein